MVLDSYREFFVAEAGASAALVGLLFVAVSVAPDRVVGDQAQLLEQARASSALSAFMIPLVLSLVALLPGAHFGISAVAVSVAALLFVAATIRRYFSIRRANREDPRGLIGLVGFTIVAGVILGYGIEDIAEPLRPEAVAAIAAATIASVLIGIDRAWALIGGRSRGRGRAIRDLLRGEDPHNR